jgi:hypothetical protein
MTLARAFRERCYQVVFLNGTIALTVILFSRLQSMLLGANMQQARFLFRHRNTMIIGATRGKEAATILAVLASAPVEVETIALIKVVVDLAAEAANIR